MWAARTGRKLNSYWNDLVTKARELKTSWDKANAYAEQVLLEHFIMTVVVPAAKLYMKTHAAPDRADRLYTLWDTSVSSDLVGYYPTLDEALAVVRAGRARNGPTDTETLALVLEEKDNFDLIARGQELAALAEGVTA